MCARFLFWFSVVFVVWSHSLPWLYLRLCQIVVVVVAVTSSFFACFCFRLLFLHCLLVLQIVVCFFASRAPQFSLIICLYSLIQRLFFPCLLWNLIWSKNWKQNFLRLISLLSSNHENIFVANAHCSHTHFAERDKMKCNLFFSFFYVQK